MLSDIKNKCLRCGFEWRQRLADVKPRVCGRCHNPYWDKPRKWLRVFDSVGHYHLVRAPADTPIRCYDTAQQGTAQHSPSVQPPISP